MKLEIDFHCLLILIYGVLRAAAITTISIDPPINPLATGFNNLIVTAQFPTPTPTTFGDSCSWFYGGELDSGSGAQFYNVEIDGCEVPSPGTYDSITCTEQTIDASFHTITALTITQPLVAGNLNIEVRCSFATTPGPITRTVQNCPSSLSYGVTITSSSRTYQASGMFSCPTGDLFYSNGTALSSGDTTCLENAEWNGQTNLQCASATAKISAEPPNNPLATGFNNLIVTAQFPTPTSNTDSCAWLYGGELDSGSGAVFYSGAFGCDPPAPGTYDSITCTEQAIDGTSHIITKLTITQPLVAGNLNIEVRCSTATTPGPIIRTVQDCPSSLPYGVVVTSSSPTYQASGMFSCPTGDLFYSNGTALPSGDTTCFANAEWSGQDNLQCWMAPSVTLASSSIDGDKLTVVEGNDLTLTCNYNDVISVGNTSQFYIGENRIIMNQGEPFILSSLQRSDNNKIVLCHAVTPYTDLYPARGRSSNYTLNVLYAATQDEIPTCKWNLNETGICSVVFFSNPNSQFVSLSKDEQTVASDGSTVIKSTGDQGQQSFTFNRKNVENSDVGRYNLTVKSSNNSLFPNSVLYFNIVNEGNGEPPGTSGLSTGAIAGIIAGVVVVILCAAGYGIYKWRRGSQKKNGSQSNEMYPTGSGNRTLTDQPGYIEVTGNDSTQINSDYQRNYEVVGPAEDENGYLAVNGSTTGHLRNRASNSQLETDNAGYIVLNGEESNADSNNQGNASSSSRRYENIEGAYDDVITAPRAHTELQGSCGL
ncbi:unnamed protein product [Clavelina lepadiformis]|uniref:Uncharacterized protein n=1 Tax=Clavelina lepadiformis TaxID=159417 RepID=A0ABP0FGB6_CLALP